MLTGGGGTGSGTERQQVTARRGKVQMAMRRFTVSPVKNVSSLHNARYLRQVQAQTEIMPKKKRLDQMLVERGLVESRTRAQALIMAGLVFSGETKLAKAGQQLPEDATLEVRGRDHPWVSRGGIKLAHALEHFALDPHGATAMDVGSSTGGFTDVLLQGGAEHVIAVDSGTNQLAWKLRQDERVTVLEQTSARVLTPEMIPHPYSWVVCDASFIGLRKVLEVPLRLAEPECRLIALIKPQFEVAREEVGKGGVVRDEALHRRVCDEVREWLIADGWQVSGIVQSPITGPEGNVEFLIAAQRTQARGG